jgi:two-component system, NtrC family, response regulator GlrR
MRRNCFRNRQRRRRAGLGWIALTCLQLDRPADPLDLPLLGENESANGLPIETLTAVPFKELKQRLVSEFERNYLEAALRRSGGNIAAAARASGKPRRTFFELMRKRGVAMNSADRSETTCSAQ